MTSLSRLSPLGLGALAEVTETVAEERRELLGEILATIRLDRNRRHMHPALLEFAEEWTRRQREIDQRELRLGVRGVVLDATKHYRERGSSTSWPAVRELTPDQSGGDRCEI